MSKRAWSPGLSSSLALTGSRMRWALAGISGNTQAPDAPSAGDERAEGGHWLSSVMRVTSSAQRPRRSSCTAWHRWCSARSSASLRSPGNAINSKISAWCRAPTTSLRTASSCALTCLSSSNLASPSRRRWCSLLGMRSEHSAASMDWRFWSNSMRNTAHLPRCSSDACRTIRLIPPHASVDRRAVDSRLVNICRQGSGTSVIGVMSF
mmetsp:Transcript_36871/g.118661  ORF Transcript_36871/g.118661 Transcript_36871/m.118661 type:complete len:208 (-) Transcript_36871:1063-1686(-)